MRGSSPCCLEEESLGSGQECVRGGMVGETVCHLGESGEWSQATHKGSAGSLREEPSAFKVPKPPEGTGKQGVKAASRDQEGPRAGKLQSQL